METEKTELELTELELEEFLEEVEKVHAQLRFNKIVQEMKENDPYEEYFMGRIRTVSREIQEQTPCD